MKDKNIKKQVQDTVTNQVMLVFGASAVLLWGVSLLSKFLDRGNTYGITLTITRILLAASLLTAGVLLVRFFLDQKNGRLRSGAILHAGIFALFFGALSACCGILLYNPITGMRLIYVFLPAVAILFLVFKVYDRQFFTFCVTHGIVAYALYRCYVLPQGGHFRLLGTLLAALICLFVAGLVLSVENRQNIVRKSLLGDEADKSYLLPLYLITLCVLTAGFLFGGKVSLVLLLTDVAYMIGAAIYFTVKLI